MTFEKTDEFIKLKEYINNKAKAILYISLISDDFSINFEHISLKSLDLTLEQDIFKKISQDTEKSLTPASISSLYNEMHADPFVDTAILSTPFLFDNSIA